MRPPPFEPSPDYQPPQMSVNIPEEPTMVEHTVSVRVTLPNGIESTEEVRAEVQRLIDERLSPPSTAAVRATNEDIRRGRAAYARHAEAMRAQRIPMPPFVNLSEKAQEFWIVDRALGTRDPWCVTCLHQHVPNMPPVTFRCDSSCGFGAWEQSLADRHETDQPGHQSVRVHHHMVDVE